MNLPPPALAAAPPAAALQRVFTALLAGAILLPTLLAFNEPPSPTLLNQVAALALWGGGVVMQMHRPEAPALPGAAWPLFAALGLAALGGLWSWLPGVLPAALAWSALGLIAAAAVLAAAGTTSRPVALNPFFIGWLVAGTLSTAIALIQVFLPSLPDGTWIAISGLPGRAVGNMRQPNHLSSLLLWSTIAVVPLMQSQRLRPRFAVPLFALFVFAISLTGSRTGGVGVALLALWGLLDKRLAGRVRLMLLAAPLLYLASLGAMTWWTSLTHHALGAATRLSEGDLSSSRFAIWSNTLALIRMHPWTGVGFGEFNFAWTLTPFPDRPVAFFDHTHNLPLQLFVELGLPLGGLVMALLLVALWQAWRRSSAVLGDDGAAYRALFMMVLMIGLHSLLEYPLWYAYFLLPTALAWGLCLGAPARQPEPAAAVDATADRSASGAADVDASTPKERPARSGRWLQAAAALVVAGSAFALWDYLRVVEIFAPGPDAGSLESRIAAGQRSVFFAHHADYAAATTYEDPALALPAAQRAAHFLLDARLMSAWAKALARSGDLDRARYVAQRLREFHKPEGDELFAPCDDPARAADWFACQPPSRPLSWKDFL